MQADSCAPKDCPATSDPVCCENGALKTAENGCVCRRSGGVVVSRNPCPKERICESIPCGSGSKACRDDGKGGASCFPWACDCQFIPPTKDGVCCEVDGRQFDSGGECYCTNCGSNGGSVLYPGKCVGPNKKACETSVVPNPVCCKRPNGSIFTAVNQKACECAGETVSQGECKEDGPSCGGKGLSQDKNSKCSNGDEVCIISKGKPACVKKGRSCQMVTCGAGKVCVQEGDQVECVDEKCS